MQNSNIKLSDFDLDKTFGSKKRFERVKMKMRATIDGSNETQLVIGKFTYCFIHGDHCSMGIVAEGDVSNETTIANRFDGFRIIDTVSQRRCDKIFCAVEMSMSSIEKVIRSFRFSSFSVLLHCLSCHIIGDTKAFAISFCAVAIKHGKKTLVDEPVNYSGRGGNECRRHGVRYCSAGGSCRD